MYVVVYLHKYIQLYVCLDPMSGRLLLKSYPGNLLNFTRSNRTSGHEQSLISNLKSSYLNRIRPAFGPRRVRDVCRVALVCACVCVCVRVRACVFVSWPRNNNQGNIVVAIDLRALASHRPIEIRNKRLVQKWWRSILAHVHPIDRSASLSAFVSGRYFGLICVVYRLRLRWGARISSTVR
jgi:hypothetical protein